MPKKNAPRIPRKGSNPAHLKAALELKNAAYTNVVQSLGNVTKMCQANSQILSQLVVMFEVLKDKQIITTKEIEDKFKQLMADEVKAKEDLEKAKEVIDGVKEEKSSSEINSNESPADSSASEVQSEDSRPNASDQPS